MQRPKEGRETHSLIDAGEGQCHLHGWLFRHTRGCVGAAKPGFSSHRTSADPPSPPCSRRALRQKTKCHCPEQSVLQSRGRPGGVEAVWAPWADLGSAMEPNKAIDTELPGASHCPFCAQSCILLWNLPLACSATQTRPAQKLWEQGGQNPSAGGTQPCQGSTVHAWNRWGMLSVHVGLWDAPEAAEREVGEPQTQVWAPEGRNKVWLIPFKKSRG